MSISRSRRYFLQKSLRSGLALGAGVILTGALNGCRTAKAQGLPAAPFKTIPEQQPLPYAYNALEPVIDAQTMEIHYTKHAAAYTKNLQEAMAAEKVAPGTSMETLMAGISKYSAKMRNNGGGHYNHELFWQCMKPGGGGEPSGRLADAIKSQFGDFAGFKKLFTETAMGRFGSGWAWLYADANKKLLVASTPNQDNPLMDLSAVRGIPMLGLDVWEHAYYLKYQNRRAEYVEQWFRIVNWDFVAKRFDALG
jgi:Fe-Mn family superoxide dismutase